MSWKIFVMMAVGYPAVSSIDAGRVSPMTANSRDDRVPPLGPMDPPLLPLEPPPELEAPLDPPDPPPELELPGPAFPPLELELPDAEPLEAPLLAVPPPLPQTPPRGTQALTAAPAVVVTLVQLVSDAHPSTPAHPLRQYDPPDNRAQRPPPH